MDQIRELIETEDRIKAHGLPGDAAGWRALKADGFADARLAKLSGLQESEVRRRRHDHGVHPVFKRVDTCAAEFQSRTPYMYSAYEDGLWAAPDGGGGAAPECESRPSERRKVMILGSGPNRIGQGIEFDYCCVHAALGLKEAGFETIMVNCNPETVSTDPDTSDRLYFEPLTAENVIEIARVEASRGDLVGAIVQLGGQTPLKLAAALDEAGIAILGTSPDAIDLAEDRDRFQQLLRQLGLRQPANAICRNEQEAVTRSARARRAPGDPPVLCAGRPGDAHRPLAGRRPAVRRRGGDRGGARHDPARPLSRGRDRGRCRRAGRRRDGGRRRHHGAYRGGGHPFGRQRLLAAPLLDSGPGAGRDRPRGQGAGPGARGAGPDERANGGAGRAGLDPRGQSAGQPHRAVRRQGCRQPDRQDRSPHHGRRAARRLPGQRPAHPAMSRSRRRCCRSRASPGSTCCSGRR